MVIEHVTLNCSCPGKYCKACDLLLCIGKFTFDSHAKDKLRSKCKECRSKEAAAYYQSNAEARKQASQDYYQKNMVTHNQFMRNHYQEHKEEYSARATVYYPQNKESYKRRGKRRYSEKKELIQTQGKQWHSANKETVNARRKKRYHQNPAIEIEKTQQYASAHPEKIQVYNYNKNERRRNAKGRFTPQEWIALKAYCNNTCLCCGRSEPEIKLTIDHIIPLILGGSNTIDNIQPLCKSCNSSKSAKHIDYRAPGRARK